VVRSGGRPITAVARNSVVNIVLNSAKEKVLGIAARRVVARVANKQTLRYRAVSEYICGSMSAYGLALEADTSVSPPVYRVDPLDATIGLNRESGCESFIDRCAGTDITAIASAVI